MKAIILAAGKGMRLRPLTYGIPKPLLPVRGVPIIDWIIRNLLTSKEIDEIIISIPSTVSTEFGERSLSYAHGVCVESYVKNLDYRCKIITVPSPQKETSGDLKYVLDEIGCKTGDVMVSYGDIFTKIDTDGLIKYHNSCKSKLNIASTLSLFQVPKKDVNKFGIAEIKKIDDAFLVKNFVEKPSTEEAHSNWANSGYYILDLDKIYDKLSGEKIKIENYLFPNLANESKLAAFVAKIPFWIDIGKLESYIEANKLALDNLIIPPDLPE